MKLQLVLLALVVAGVCAHGDHGGEATYAADSPVVSLTSETFAEGVKKSKLVLVEFYAPWCGHCKSLKPHYEEAAQAVKSAGLDATLAAVDATTAEDVSTKYGIRGFPTLKLFRNGELTETEYDGERNAEAIFEWVSAFFAPALVDLNTQDDVDKLTQGRKVVVLGHFTLPEQAAAQKAFHEAVAAVREEKSFSHVKFGEVKNAELAKKLGLDVSVPVVSVRRDFGADNEEAKEVNFDFFTDAGFDTAKMANFIRSSAFPILAEITPENYSSYEKRGLPFVWVFLPGHGVSAGPDGEAKENPADVNAKNKQYRALVREVATPYAARLSFVYLSGVDYADHATGLGVSSFPGICIMPTEGRAKFIFDQEFTADNVRGFVTGFLDKKLAPSIKSEPVPEKQEGPVKVVVAKTFDAEVYDSDNDVFIEFYAPWCGHCKKLAPVWDELATLLKNTKGITIAKIDATANDVPEQIEGFPTLYFKKAGNKEHKIDPAFLYDGDRTKEALMQYIREQSSATLPELPADTGKISKFVDQFTKMQKEITKLVKENEELKARVAELEGSGAHSHDHGHDHHDHDHDHHHHDHDHHGHHHGHDDL